jgi:hypothetical protein
MQGICTEQIDWRQPLFYEDTPLERLVMGQIEQQDPELLADPKLVVYARIGAAYIRTISEHYGTPARPQWCTGSEKSTFMSFHNGQSEDSSGHTSMDPEGFGVPFNVLSIAKQLNHLADLDGRPEVVNPLQRARALGAACAHDYVQLCGRSIFLRDKTRLEERGDEYLSAHNSYLTARANGIGLDDAGQMAIDLLATQCDPKTGQQLIDYTQSESSVLEQETVAGADLISVVRSHSPWTNFLYSIELCDAELQQAITAEGRQAQDYQTIDDILHLIGRHAPLREAFNKNILYGFTFVKNIRYQDSTIQRLGHTTIENIFVHKRGSIVLLAKQVNTLVTQGISPVDLGKVLQGKLQ